MTRALVAHPGTQHAFRLAAELYRLHALSGLHTCFAAGQGSAWQIAIETLPRRLRSLFANRRVQDIPAALFHLQPGLEFAWQARKLLVGEGQALLHWRNRRFQLAVPEESLRDTEVVIGFDTSSWVLADRCSYLGKPLVLVQTIGHPDAMEAVAEIVARRFPAWESTREHRLAPVRQAEQIEHNHSDIIVCSSQFTRSTLVERGVARSKIRVMPHGVDLARFRPGPPRTDRRVRFLFVGAISSRKGVPLLLEAWRELGAAGAELWLLGPLTDQVKALLPTFPGLRVLGAVPGETVPDIMRQCDVLVFPSYFEGFGLVILQAMACGLPVITTTATAGPDLIASAGAGGWIIPVDDGPALVDAMAHCLKDRAHLPEIGRIARSIAEHHSWEVFGRNWIAVIEEGAALSGTSDGRVASDKHHRRDRVLLVHPGTQYSHHLARELYRRGRLEAFCTGFAIRKNGWTGELCSMLPDKTRQRLSNRIIGDLPQNKLCVHPLIEIESFIRRGDEKTLHRRNEAFQRAVMRSRAGPPEIAVGFDTSSWLIADWVKASGGKFILDQSIGHPLENEGIFRELRKRYPDWSLTVRPKSGAHIAEEQEEHRIADLIVAPSTYVKQTLIVNGVEASKIRVIPFGTDLDLFCPDTVKQAADPVVFLFVGSLSVRKGIPVLLEAWRSVQGANAELWLVGPGSIPSAETTGALGSLTVFGPKSRAEVASLMRCADVFVFPSFFEGLAQVQVEALASGLPVVGTRESGAEDVVENGCNGFIVPAGDSEALADHMKRFVTDRPLLVAMRENAIERRPLLSWTKYGDAWATILDEVRF